MPQHLQKITKLISGSRDILIVNLDMKTENTNDFSNKANRNSDPVQSSKVSLVNIQVVRDITWPDNVRALEKLFLGMFLNCYCVITV